MRPVLAFVLCVCIGEAFAEKQPYSRYQSIVDRQMFGALPAGFDPTKLPSEVTKSSQKELTKEQEQLKSAIRFSVINMTPDGQVAVGFTDSSDGKNPCHYYLKVGESRGGWLVKEADPETATMTIAKGEIEVTLTIGGDSAKSVGATARAGHSAAGGAAGLRALSAGGTLRSRRRARAAAEQQQTEALRKQLEEERQAREAEKAAEREEQDRQFQEQKRQMEELRADLKARFEAARKERENAAEKETSEHENDDAE